MHNLKSIIDYKLVCIAIFFMPFLGAFERMWLPGFGYDGCAYPLFLAGILMIIFLFMGVVDKKGYPINNSSIVLLALPIWSILSGFFNLNRIYTNSMYTTTGLGMYMVNIVQQIFFIFSCWYVYKCFMETDREPIIVSSNLIMISFMFTGLYSLIELLGSFGEISVFQNVLTFIDSMFRSEMNYDFGKYGEKIRSLAMESSYFGAYSSIIYPFVLYRVVCEHNKKKIIYGSLALYLIVLNYLSYSRTAYFVIIIESIAFLYLIRSLINLTKGNIVKYVSVLLIVGGIFAGVSSSTSDNSSAGASGYSVDEIVVSALDINDLERMNSNVTRYSSKLAALFIGLDNPIFGVGVGQFGFYAADYYPDWAWLAPDIRMMNSEQGRFPVAYDFYLKLFSELGFIGIIIYLLFLYRIFVSIKSIASLKSNVLWRACLITSMIGIVLSGGNFDFWEYGFAIIIGIVWAQTEWYKEHDKL